MGIIPSKWAKSDWGQRHLSREHVDIIDFVLPADQFFLIKKRLYHKSWCIPNEVYEFNIHHSKFREVEGGVVCPWGSKIIPIDLLPELVVHVKYGNVQTSPGWHYPHLYAEIRNKKTDRLISETFINVDNLYDFEDWQNRYLTAYDVNLNHLPISSTKIKYRKF